MRNREGNDDVLRAVQAQPDRFWGLAAVNPWFGDQAIEELERSLDAGLKGLKVASHLQGFVLSDPIVHLLVEVCREYDAPLYAHTGTPVTAEPFQLAELARAFPDVTMVMGHMGYTDFWYDAVPAALQSENIYLETSLIDIMNIQNAIAKVGAERILLGSDYPESDLSLELEKISMIDMDDDTRRRILGANAQKVWT